MSVSTAKNKDKSKGKSKGKSKSKREKERKDKIVELFSEVNYPTPEQRDHVDCNLSLEDIAGLTESLLNIQNTITSNNSKVNPNLRKFAGVY